MAQLTRASRFPVEAWTASTSGSHPPLDVSRSVQVSASRRGSANGAGRVFSLSN